MKLPIAMTIAGSDSGGGAGLQADLKTFAALDVFGTSVVTCVTAQNPRRVAGVVAMRPSTVRQQLETVWEAMPPRAVKTGMLYSAGIISAIADFLAQFPRTPVVVDPVMVATSGARLLQPNAIKTYQRRLLPHARLITPNRNEAEILAGFALRSVEDLRRAARTIHHQFGCAVLVKGGHLQNLDRAVDILCEHNSEHEFSAPFIRGISTHGTGCTYSAAIAGYLALGCPLTAAVNLAKSHITQALAQAHRAGRFTVLNPFWSDPPLFQK